MFELENLLINLFYQLTIGSIRTPPIYALLIIPKTVLFCSALLYSIPTNLSCHCSYYENNKAVRSIGVKVDDRRMRNIASKSHKNKCPASPPPSSPLAPPRLSPLVYSIPFHRVARPSLGIPLVALLLSMACCKLQGRCSRPPCRLERLPNKGSVGPSAAARV